MTGVCGRLASSAPFRDGCCSLAHCSAQFCAWPLAGHCPSLGQKKDWGARVGPSGAVRPTQRLPHHVVHRGTGMMPEDGVTGEGPRPPSRRQSCLLPTVLANEAYQSEVAFSGMLHQNSCKRVYLFKQGESLTRKWQRLSQTEFCCSFENKEAAHSGSYDEPESARLKVLLWPLHLLPL